MAKLNVRTDSLGLTNAQFQSKLSQWAKELATWYLTPSLVRRSKPVYQWYSPDAAKLVAAESSEIVATLKRKKTRNPEVTGTVWEIGNEPNFIPAITPQEYAAIFENYFRVIKQVNPDAKIALGSIFIPEVAEDLKLKFAESLEAQLHTQLD